MENTNKKETKEPSKIARILSRERSKIWFLLAFVVPAVAVYVYACVSQIF